MSKQENVPPPPEASLPILISMLATQSASAMGQLKVPGQEMPEKRMDYAKHFIDLLAVLEAKTRGNTTTEESEMLQQTIHQLRLLYVQSLKT